MKLSEAGQGGAVEQAGQGRGHQRPRAKGQRAKGQTAKGRGQGRGAAQAGGRKPAQGSLCAIEVDGLISAAHPQSGLCLEFRVQGVPRCGVVGSDKQADKHL